MNADIKSTVKSMLHALNTSKHNHMGKHTYNTSYKQWEVVGADIFSVKNTALLCIHSKFPLVKKTDGFSADNLTRAAKIVFAEFGLPRKIVSDAGMCRFSFFS